MSPKSFTTTYAGSKTTFQNASSQYSNPYNNSSQASTTTRNYNVPASRQVYQLPAQIRSQIQNFNSRPILLADNWAAQPTSSDVYKPSAISQAARVSVGLVSGVGKFASEAITGTWSWYSDSVNSMFDMAAGGYFSNKFPEAAQIRARNDARGNAIVNAPKKIADSAKKVYNDPRAAYSKTKSYVRNAWLSNIATPYNNGDGITAGMNLSYSALGIGTIFSPRGVVAKVGAANLGKISKVIHEGQQGKHVVGHNNAIDLNRSFLNTDIDPQALLNGIHDGTYQIVGKTSRGQDVVDFGRAIGVDNRTGLSTRFGTIHSGAKGAHIVPANPLNKLK